jgi:hypothetical protein
MDPPDQPPRHAQGPDDHQGRHDRAPALGRVDARKWFASKVAPKKYGDRAATELSGPNGEPLAPPVINIYGKPLPEKT